MKRFVFVFSLLLLFFALTVQAQNNSAENSDVIFMHYYDYGLTGWITCPETDTIVLTYDMHVVYKDLPNGAYSDHFNVHGEGIDQNGDLWKFNDLYNGKWIPGVTTHLVRYLTLKGPKGATLKMRSLIVRNGNGEIIHWKFDPLCD